MSLQGRILIVIAGLWLITLIINLVRTRKLHVGYAVIWLLAVSGLIVMVAVPPLLDLITRAVGAIFPASALSLLAFVFIFLVLIFISVQLSMLSSRVTEMAQSLAMSKLREQEEARRESMYNEQHLRNIRLGE
jgi:hypothetical protein